MPSTWILAQFLAASVMAGGCAVEAAHSPPQGAEDMEQLKAMVLKGDPTANLRAEKLGKAASPMLRELAKHADDRVRLLAVQCLMSSGGPDASAAFLAALTDGNAQIASEAGRGLFQTAVDARSQTALFEAFDKTPHGSVRGLVARLIGTLDKAADVAALRKRWEAETDPTAKEDETVALARLGVKEAQEDFVRRLHAAREWRLREYLERHVRYIGQPWILKPLLAILDDKTKLINLNIDGLKEPPMDVRACDLAATRAAQISSRKFSFKPEDLKIYTDAQVEELRRYLQSL
jgi:HEAT repeat protein